MSKMGDLHTRNVPILVAGGSYAHQKHTKKMRCNNERKENMHLFGQLLINLKYFLRVSEIELTNPIISKLKQNLNCHNLNKI